ncbi:hypothetical protein ACFYP6_19865 [Streptomyces goshikiensis]
MVSILLVRELPGLRKLRSYRVWGAGIVRSLDPPYLVGEIQVVHEFR